MVSIKEKYQCCGCGACEQRCPKHCIELVGDSEGFWYPSVNENDCIQCGLCEKVCPIINGENERHPQNIFAARHEDEHTRLESSSGGMFTLLAEQTLRSGGVVFGAMWNEQWEVRHGSAKTIHALERLRCSKYVQSEIGNTFIQVEENLKVGNFVLFSGTPCQVAGLKKFLRKDYSNLVTVDFVCHGVPSPLVWKKYLHSKMRPLDAAGKNTVSLSLKVMPSIEGISFRDKRNGWKKYGFAVKGKSALKVDKNTVSPSVNTETLIYEPLDENAYLHGFVRNLFLRPSCYQCAFKSFRSGSDYTLADFWGANIYVGDYDDDKGISLLFIHNDKCDILNNCVDFRPVDMSAALAQNPAIIKSSKMKDGRSEFFNKLSKYDNTEHLIRRYSRYSIREYTRNELIKLLVRTNLLSIIKRLLHR